MKSKSSREPANTDVSRLITIARRTYAKNRKHDLLATVTLCLGVALTGFLVIITIEQYAYLRPKLKILLTGLLLLAVGSVAVWRNRTTTGKSFNQFYIRFSRFATLPALKDAFDLYLNRKDSRLKLYDAALSQNLQSLDTKSVRHKLKLFLQAQNAYKQLKLNTIFLSLAALVTLFTIVFLPEAALRILHLWNRYEVPNPYAYVVEPGNITVEQGGSIAPYIVFDKNHPKRISLQFKTDVEKEYRTRPVMRVNQDTVFFGSIRLNSNGSYYIMMDGFQSPYFRAEVQLLPRFESLTAMIIPPAYTGLDTTSLSYPFSNIKAYQGSQVVLSGVLNKQLSRLLLIRTAAKNDSIRLQPAATHRVTDTIRVAETDTVAFAMRDTSGLVNRNPFEFVIEPISDEPPSVSISEPKSALEMKEPKDLAIRYEASDDFGLTSSSLRYSVQRAFSEPSGIESVQLTPPVSNQQMSYTWKLQELNPRPRDVITYWIEVTDNNSYDGPQTALSRKLTITFPSLASYLDELENKEQNVKETLEAISESHQQLRQEYDQFKENLKQNPEGNWEQQQTLAEVKERQQELNEKVDKLNKKFEEIRREMESTSAVSDETLKAYDELQKLMKEINDPELLKALKELQNSLSSMDQQQLKEALQSFEFNEQQYQERIKRTIELFKTLKMNSDLEKAAIALEALADQEKELLENKNSTENKVEKQKAIQEDTQKLSDELQNLSQNAPERSKNDINKLEQESIERLEAIKKQLNDNIQKMNKASGSTEQSEKVRSQQQQIQQNFRQMARQLRNARKQLGQQRAQINMTALQYILYSLINLSQNQEELTRTTEQLSSRSQAFVKQARIQQTIADQFDQLSDSLYKVSAEVPGFSNKINEKKMLINNHLNSAVEMLAERDRSQSTFASRQVLAGFNELASMLATLLDQMQNQQQGAGGGMSMQQFVEQLQQMSGQQQEMNRRIDELINDIQGDRLSNKQIDRLNQLARQQNQIRKQIKELQQNGGLESGDRILSELERLSQEMEQTINDLRGGQADKTLVRRQQNILSRMLNAEKALDERGKDREREATSAEASPQSTPPDLTLEELQKNIRRLLNDPEKTRYSQDYQQLIEQYFELLKELEAEN